MHTDSADEFVQYNSLRHSIQPGASLVSRARVPSPLRNSYPPRGTALARGGAPPRAPSILARGAGGAQDSAPQPMDAEAPRSPPSLREASPPANRPAGTPDSRAAGESSPSDPAPDAAMHTPCSDSAMQQ